MIRINHPALTIALMLVCALSLPMLAGCDDESTAADNVAAVDSDETWAIYWYLCGSDLESEAGAATADLEEMMSVDVSENVQVVIETGGANSWESDVDPSKLQRWCYSSSGMELVEEQPLANMGEASTLADFLSFCSENYPADHTAVIFWNHGGGTLGGVAYDELFDYDSLSLSEIHDAFAQVYDLAGADKPIELVGFDACLMASIDTASAVSDVAEYLVASEESEPACGWWYSALLSGLSRNTGMDGATLGTLICDTFLEGCENSWVDDEATLSVVDLSKIPALLEAYDAAGAEALDYVRSDSHFYSKFSRAAEASENYGGNTPSAGYTDMVDLGDLLTQSGDILPESSQAVLDALDDAVVYKVAGPYRENSSGLSCYHAYDGDAESYEVYSEEASSETFDSFYAYCLTGIDDGTTGSEAVSNAQSGGSALDVLPGSSNSGDLDDFALVVTDEGFAQLNLGPTLAEDLSSVLVHMAYVDYEGDLIIDLGNDSNVNGDWDAGVFEDNFYGMWASIDGALCYLEVAYGGDDYTLYNVPALLNGNFCYLSCAYDYNDEAYEIMGARSASADGAMADKNLTKLEAGDELTMVLFAVTISGDEDLEYYEGDTITVGDDTSMYDVDMGDGDFMLYFEMIDAQNESFYSQNAYFTVEGDDIYVEVD